MDTIGKRLRAERERLGVSQTALGAIGGVLKQAQIKYESDARKPDADYLASVADAGLDVQYVITGERSHSSRFVQPKKPDSTQKTSNKTEPYANMEPNSGTWNSVPSSGDEIGRASKDVRLDRSKLRDAIEAVQSAIDAVDVEVSAVGQARLIEAIYLRLVEHPKTHLVTYVHQLLRAIREDEHAGG